MAKVYFDSLAISDSYKPLIVGDKDIVAGIKKVSSHKKDHSFKLAELKFGEQNVWMNNKDTHVVVDGQTFKTPTTIEGIQQGIDLGEWTEEDILTNIKDSRALNVSNEVKNAIKIVKSDIDLMTAALEHDDTMDKLMEMKEANPNATRKALLIEIGQDLADQGLI